MSQLSNNTTALQAILEAVEALPEAIAEIKSATGTYTPSAASGALSVTGLDFDPYVLIAHAPAGTVSSGLALGVGTPSGAWNTSYIYLQDASYAHSNGQGTLTLGGTTFGKGIAYTWYAYGV